MAIKAYTGIMGSGKSYEVVTSVILPAVKKRRRVVTNIAGLDLLEFSKSAQIDIDEIQLVTVEHSQVESHTFWLTDSTDKATVIEAGDLVCLDEIWRFWDGFKNPPEFVMNFVRMHRHFPHPETGVTCDLVLITQDVMDIGPKVRRVVEETYRMSKLTMIGRPDRYRIDVFSGWQKKDKLRSLQRKYNPELFSLYKSHSQQAADSADATESNVDDRGNILSGGFFKFVIPLALLLTIGSGYYVLSFFSSGTTQPPVEKNDQSTTHLNDPKPPITEKQQRVVGYSQTDSGTTVYSYDGESVVPLFRAPATKITSLTIEALNHDGKIISNTTYVEPVRTQQPQRASADSELPVR
ncbi:MAG: zonular occludens toxin domain-containing protein [Limnobacter sp.]|jgi:zona occludens toxin